MFECLMASPNVQRNMEGDQPTLIGPRGLTGKWKAKASQKNTLLISYDVSDPSTSDVHTSL